MDKSTKRIICTNYTNGKTHDFKLYKKSKLPIKSTTKTLVDTGFIGIKKYHDNSELPIKRTKKNPLTKEDKKYNRKVSSERVLNENVIGCIKKFGIVSDRYRNRRKRFGLRFNLIAGVYNFELDN